MRKPNYDKYPATKVDAQIHVGWDQILPAIADAARGRIIAVDTYPGADEEEIASAVGKAFGKVLLTRSLMKSEESIREMTDPFMTDDVLFGFLTSLRINDFFDQAKVAASKAEMDYAVVVGPGASLIAPEGSSLVYADMARWEIQMRMRRHTARGLGVDNRQDPVSIQYKRGLFIDWHVCDIHKDSLFTRVDFWLDTNDSSRPKMIGKEAFFQGIDRTVSSPFRVVPFFDPAPWGGQWMKEVCDLDQSKSNYGWCFDCVPEENSLLFKIKDELFELPSQDLVLLRSRKLLGDAVESRFGKDFPIRFDFLDTIGGGNLSLQVHPTTQFIRENFGIPYTQDESYYLLDAVEDAVVFLGLKTGIDPEAMINDLRAAQRGELVFDAEKYANKLPAKKHDHFLIPAGTVHCSGAGSMVLEISATPNIFTFKLWDWGRLGLDGKPRPINVERGSKVIQWERNTEYVKSNLWNHFEPVASGEGWEEIRTGLHPNEFIETRRTKFSAPVTHNTGGGVNVLNLVEGDEVIVTSPAGSFDPFIVHYAETFIIPAWLGEYVITPHGLSEGKTCMTIKAYVRT
ncbi:MAG: class I mannose-6-phosphate isomerase [Bacteroidales bacterium]|nr:class I mannose-6-phosphate isomerase [Bacteroidales bacterium]